MLSACRTYKYVVEIYIYLVTSFALMLIRQSFRWILVTTLCICFAISEVSYTSFSSIKIENLTFNSSFRSIDDVLSLKKFSARWLSTSHLSKWSWSKGYYWNSKVCFWYWNTNRLLKHSSTKLYKYVVEIYIYLVTSFALMLIRQSFRWILVTTLCICFAISEVSYTS
jgi:hypothetical protein